MKNTLKRIILCTLIVCLLQTVSLVAFAAPQTTELINVTAPSDILVQITYDGDSPAGITFISPSGARIAEGSADPAMLKSVKGEGWIHYRLYNAEVGKWMIEYDKSNSKNASLQAMLANQNLLIRSFSLNSLEGSYASVSFHTAYDGSGISYRYEIYAAIDETGASGSRLLAEGSAYSDADVTRNIDLSNLTSYGAYKLRLEVYADTGSFEIFDSAETAPFKYSNPKVVTPLSDVDIKVDTKTMQVSVNWADKTYGDVFISAFADDGTEPFFYQNFSSGETKEIAFDYLNTHKKLKVYVYTRDNGVLSQPLVKEFPVDNTAVKIEADEITNRIQAKIVYDLPEKTDATLVLNNDSQLVRLEGKDEFSVTLADSYNTLSVSYPHNGVTYIISKDIYLDRTPPTLTLFEDLDKKTFDSTELIITGKTDSSAVLNINGQTFNPDNGGTFSHTLTLQHGENTFDIKASDSAGNIATKTITVFCGPQDAQIEETTFVGTLLAYLPLLISIAVSLICILLIVLLLKKRSAPKKICNSELPQKVNMLNIASLACFALSIVALMFTAFNIIEYFRVLDIINAPTFLDIAENSINKAYEYIELCDSRFLSFILGGIATILLVVGGIVLKIQYKKQSNLPPSSKQQ